MDRILELEKLIKKYAASYYSGIAEISDDEFDELVEELRELDPQNSLLETPGWGYIPAGHKLPHDYNMTVGSLNKVKEVTNIPPRFTPTNTRISAKLDGLSVVAYYKDGHRVMALTRGNGKEGMVVTEKLNVISPNTETLRDTFTGAVRGEVLMDYDTWEKVKDRYKDNPSANPRNLAAGILNRNAISDDLKLLRYVVYKVVADPEKLFDIQTSDSTRFKSTEDFLYNSFDFVPEISFTNSLTFSQSTLEDYYENFKKKFPCDGIVFTKREVKYAESGEILYDEFAYKFQAETAIVTVTDVDWNVGRTGRVIPRIWFDPVNLSGAMVRKCTGHTAANIRNNVINKGTVVEVTRSNEVIPYMMRVVENPCDSPLIPEVCPNCGAPLEWDGEHLICPFENTNQLIARFISSVTDVEGVGWKLESRIIEILELSSYDDLLNFLRNLQDEDKKSEYLLKIKNQIGGLTAEKCCQLLEQLTQEINPVTFIAACNIPGFSWNSANSLLREYPTFLKDAEDDQIDTAKIYQISGFGHSAVTAISRFRTRISDLLKCVKIAEVVEPEEGFESQFSVAITGSLSVKRSEFEKFLKDHGVIVSGNFKEIKYLITNDPDTASSKMKKAKANGVEVISEDDIRELLNK